MNRQSLIHYATYLVLIVVLIFPLSLLSMPSEITETGARRSPGKLASLRDEYRLGQADLGRIDPASETLKLATLGMRGVASNLLWEKANRAKEREDWTGLSAALEQIANLQPNYVGVWLFQGWNVAYNISVEWDDYRDRYFWVTKGIRFLQEGTLYNENDPKLVSEVGRVAGQKIGRADERVQFRRLFRDDDDFHRDQVVKQRDNWLFGKEWHRMAERLVENRQGSLGSMAELIFYSQAPLAQISYVSAREDDGIFDEQTRGAWQQASAEWQGYGNRQFPNLRGTLLRMTDYQNFKNEVQRKRAEFDVLTEGVLERVVAEKRNTLSAEQRKALDTDPAARSDAERRLAEQATILLQTDYLELAERVAEANRETARKLAEEIVTLEQDVADIDKDRNTVNFDYWEQRCVSESSGDALLARRLLFEADKAFDEADLLEAKAKYEQGFEAWSKVVDANEALLDDATSFDMATHLSDYFEVLRQLDLERPAEFPLKEIWQLHREQGQIPGL